MENNLTQKHLLDRLVYAIKHEVNYYSRFNDSDPIINQDYQIVKQALTELETIKEIGKKYNWDKITSEILNVKTDKKIRELFSSAIIDIQEDYQKARKYEKQTQILEVLKNKRMDIYDFDKIVSKNCDNLTKLFLYNEKRRIESKLTACEYKLIKEWLKL